MRVSNFVKITTLVLGVAAAPATVVAQRADSLLAERAPRFLLAGRPLPRELDASRTPTLSRSIALTLEDVTVAAALAVVEKESGLHIVYGDAVLPVGRRVHLRASRISVAGALTEILLDAGLDVLMGESGQAVLVKRTKQGVGVDVLRGSVRSDSGRPVVGALIAATMSPDRTFQTTNTDSSGHYEIRFATGTGDFLLHASALGYETFRKRVTFPPGDTLVATDIVLAKSAVKLAAMNVRAERPKPTRNPDPATEPGSRARETTLGLNGALSPDRMGDLAFMASTVPGVSIARDGSVQALGLAGQGTTTLNGMAFAGAELPRGANAQVQVSTSAQDPAQGGFGSVRTNVQLSSGSRFTVRNLTAALDAPPMQFGNAAGNQLGQRFSNITSSFSASGELNPRWTYNGSMQLSSRATSATTLLTASPDALSLAGVAADSVSRLVGLLRSSGVSLAGASVPSSARTQKGIALFRLDHAPRDSATDAPARSTWNVAGYGLTSSTDAVSFSPTATPARGGSRSDDIGQLAFSHSLYFGDDYLNDVTLSVSGRHSVGTPYQAAPGALVLVSSALRDDAGGFSTLAFGGDAALDYHRNDWTAELRDQAQLFDHSRHHLVRATADVRWDNVDRVAGADTRGTYTYNSIADLAANRPAMFTRTLDAPAMHAGMASGFVALNDVWRVSPKLQLQYGARLEGNEFGSAPAYNAEVDRLFGLRTDHVPNSVHASPRLGLTWAYGEEDDLGFGCNLGGCRLIEPAGVVRMGFGEFRSALSPSRLVDAFTTTGLPGSGATIRCVGSAVPSPDWRVFSGGVSAPMSCGASASTFADAAPDVLAFDRAFAPARSWRGNIGWASHAFGLEVGADAVYSLNLDQPGHVDLNFAGAPRFVTPDEGRSVFVNPSSIDPLTGTLALADARRSALYGHVENTVSTMTSRTRQLTLSADNSIFSSFYVGVSYTLADVRDEPTGFDGSAFGDPRVAQPGPSDLDVRHRVQVRIARNLPRGLGFSLLGTFSSGAPFTPVIAGDVNGDGSSNDRAFIFNPASVSDPALASGLRALQATGSSAAKECLARQLGKAAERNSCRGPWTAALNARLDVAARPGITSRAMRASINLSNPLAAVDMLLHGSNGLRGWGNPAFPDPVLYQVRGFNPATNRFAYEVNPRFGSTRSSLASLSAPFRVSLDVSMNLGAPFARQMVRRNLDPGRNRGGARLSTDMLKRRLMRSTPTLYALVLQQSDSLLLSPDQVSALRTEDTRFSAKVDSVWTAVATEFEGLGAGYDEVAAMWRIEHAAEDVWAMAWQERDVLRRILNAIQLRLAPSIVQRVLSADKPVNPHFTGL